MLVANAVVDTDQPRLQVGENQMDDRQVLLGNLWITTLGNSEVLIAALTEASMLQSSVTISDPGATVLSTNPQSDSALRSSTTASASGIASVFPVVELGARLSMTHLDGTGDENLVVNTTAFPTRSPANPRPPQHGSWAVHRSCLGWAAPCPSLVENLKGRQRERPMPLKLPANMPGV